MLGKVKVIEFLVVGTVRNCEKKSLKQLKS